MNYNEKSTEELENIYKELCYTNISWLNKDIIETIRGNTDRIASILYHRQHIREMEERRIDNLLDNMTNK